MKMTPFWVLIAAGWFWVLGGYFMDQVKTNDHYLEVHQVEVLDATVGEVVRMSVDRDINSEFEAHWYVEVQALNAAGSFYNVCWGNGGNIYEPTDTLPGDDENDATSDGLTLDWWIGHNRCVLKPGKYRVVTVWNLKTAGRPRRVKAVSNIFEVESNERIRTLQTAP